MIIIIRLNHSLSFQIIVSYGSTPTAKAYQLKLYHLQSHLDHTWLTLLLDKLKESAITST